MGRETEIDKVWSMIRRMNTIIREYGHPVLNDGEVTAVKNEEKAHKMAKTFGKIHNSINIRDRVWRQGSYHKAHVAHKPEKDDTSQEPTDQLL